MQVSVAQRDMGVDPGATLARPAAIHHEILSVAAMAAMALAFSASSHCDPGESDRWELRGFEDLSDP
jgi:hypothetical protein